MGICRRLLRRLCRPRLAQCDGQGEYAPVPATKTLRGSLAAGIAALLPLSTGSKADAVIPAGSGNCYPTVARARICWWWRDLRDRRLLVRDGRGRHDRAHG